MSGPSSSKLSHRLIGGLAVGSVVVAGLGAELQAWTVEGLGDGDPPAAVTKWSARPAPVVVSGATPVAWLGDVTRSSSGPGGVLGR